MTNRNAIVLNCVMMAVRDNGPNSRNTVVARVVRGYGKHYQVTAKEVANVLDSKVCDLLLPS